MEHPFLFVLFFLACMLAVIFYLTWQHNRQEALEEYLQKLPARAIFPKVRYRILNLMSVSLGEADMFIFENGFILAGEGAPDYFFTRKNDDLWLPSSTIEWILKEIEANGGKSIITAVSNALAPRYEKFHFSFKNSAEVERLVAALARFHLTAKVVA